MGSGGRGGLRCVLFDADGVLQSSPNGWLSDLRSFAPNDPDAFTDDIFSAEVGPVRGHGSFRDTAAEVLRRHGSSASVDDVTEIWSRLRVDESMLEAIGELRADGVICALATNQHDVRTAIMRTELPYGRVLDAQFYSCELGHYKPEPSYFTSIVETLGVPVEQTLFVDDREDNVLGARSIGLRAEVFAENGGRAELERILALHT